MGLRSIKMDEGEWVALVTRIEEAMCVIPFMPRQEDVITLMSMAVNSNQHMLRAEDLAQVVERLHGSSGTLTQRLEFAQDEIERLTKAEGAFLAEVARLRAALAEIADLELEGDASLADAMKIADEALNP